MAKITILNWGLIPYQEALTKQLELVEQISLQPEQAYIVFCKHPEVVTLGRSTKPGDVFGWDGELIEVSRGGRATYHGPSQIVIYPIISLKHPRKLIPSQEVVGYLRVLENSLIEFLKLYDIEAIGKSLQKNKIESDKEAEETGVWVGSQKIASLGIAVKKWVTYHGAAINIFKDPMAYRGMNPCGFSKSVMTSLEEKIASPLNEEAIMDQLTSIFLKNFADET